MRAVWTLPLALVVAGAALIADAVARGEATVAWVVIVPVVSGASLEFLAGTLLAVAGIVTVPFAALGSAEPERSLPSGTRPSDAAPSSGTGGLVLIGPVPILFGSWRSVSRRTRTAVAVVGAVLLFFVVVAFVLGIA